MNALLLLAQLGLATPTGTEVASSMVDLNGRQRQAVFVQQLLDRQVPDHLGRLYPVRWIANDTRGGRHVVEIDVLRDYVAIGTDADFLRAPLDLPSAIAVGRAWRMILPTPKMVDEIYAHATDRLSPRPMSPSDRMRSVWAYLTYRARLSEQGATRPTEGLRVGHKKDLVLTPQLEDHADRVAIYGWHRTNGTAIQGLSLWHGAGYTDYSHGVRFVSPEVRVDSHPMDFFALLADPVLWPLVSREGPWAGARAVMWPDSDPGYVEYVPD